MNNKPEDFEVHFGSRQEGDYSVESVHIRTKPDAELVEKVIVNVDAWIANQQKIGDSTFSRDFIQHWTAYSGDIAKAALSAMREWHSAGNSLEGTAKPIRCESESRAMQTIQTIPVLTTEAVKVCGLNVREMARLKDWFYNKSGKNITEFWEEAFNKGVKTALYMNKANGQTTPVCKEGEGQSVQTGLEVENDRIKFLGKYYYAATHTNGQPSKEWIEGLCSLLTEEGTYRTGTGATGSYVAAWLSRVLKLIRNYKGPGSEGE